jgi:hypothetical protein
MKRIFCIFLLSVLLTSCANLASPEVTVTPQATSTLTPTFTPTVTPTITLTPTETPDPNKPSDATGKDPSTGEYTKSVEENGATVIYVWKQFQFGDDLKNGISGHWFKSWMENGPINLTEYGESCKNIWGEPFTLNMNVYAVEGQADLSKFGYIFHPDRKLEWDKYQDEAGWGVSCSTISLSNVIMDDLFLRYLNLLPSDSDKNKYLRLNDYYVGKVLGQQATDHKNFMKALTSGELTIKMGDDVWSPKNGYEMYWIDESMAMNDPSMAFSLSGGTKDYYVKTMVKDGKLIAFIAPAKWLKDQLAWPKKDSRERTFKAMILFPLEAAITSDYPIKGSFLPFQDYQGKSGIISGTINNQSIYIDIPYIDFTSVQ